MLRRAFPVARAAANLCYMSPLEQYGERIGDAERDRAMRRLTELTGSGHLFLPEFEERARQVAGARTRAELDEVFAGLPAERSSSAAARRDNLKIAGTALPTVGLMLAAGFLGLPLLFFLALFIPAIVWLSGRGPSGFYREN